MVPTLSASVVERLQLARFELVDGRAELAASTKAGANKAIKSFHDALETFVIAVAEHVGAPPDFRQFHEYPKILKTETGKAFKHLNTYRNVNALRTPAKHSALYSTVESVEQLSSQLNPVFEDNAQQYLGVSFFAVKLASTIGHEFAREKIAAAEEALDRDAYEEALGQLAVAFTVAVMPAVEKRCAGKLIGDELMQYATALNPRLPSHLRRIDEAFERLEKRMALLESGVDLATYERFVAVTPTVFVPGDPRFSTIYGLSSSELLATRENASFALSFVIDAIRRLEATKRPRSASSLFHIRATRQASCVDWNKDGELEEVKKLAAGEEIPAAYCASGPTGTVWSWECDGRHLMVPFDACEILSETTRDEQAEQYIQSLIRARQVVEGE